MEQIAMPCAACEIKRKKCGAKCVLAPYFSPHDPQKFLIVDKVFGANNILRILRDVPAAKREDAVSSMVFEAGARVDDPVYGCAGTVYLLQQQILDLESQLAATQAELLNTQAILVSLVTASGPTLGVGVTNNVVDQNDDFIVLEDVADPFCSWEPQCP